MKFCNSKEYLYLTVHVDNSWYYVKGEHIQFHNVIVFFFFLEADQHENLRQEVVRKRRGFDSVVKYTSVFDWRTVWTFCRNKLYGMTILAWKLFCRENQSFLFSGEAVEHFFLLYLDRQYCWYRRQRLRHWKLSTSLIMRFFLSCSCTVSTV